jgi:ribosome biogenesis GTPase
VTGDGLEELAALLAPGRTAALLGPSGAGKSTLVNALRRYPPGDARGEEADLRGRHATTHRELFALPSGALLVDTPGLRELALWDGADGIAATYDEVSTLASTCRFRDCRHEGEPGCAVLEAAEAGVVDRDRVAAWEKLRREEEALEMRRSLGPARAERLRWKRIMGGAKGPEKMR